MAKRLQPLLEQEALLESFIEEAMAHRKFEDLKALKINLAEIRQEIERLRSRILEDQHVLGNAVKDRKN